MPPPAPRRLVPLLCLLLAAPAHAQPDAPGGPGAARPASWIAIEAPDEGAAVSLPLVEVRGRAAPAGAASNDLVIAIDVSDSVLLPSGWDVDGDGPGGRSQPWWSEAYARDPVLATRMREGDLDDSVLMAELAAARALSRRARQAVPCRPA